MKLPTVTDHAESIALFRCEVIGALSRRELMRGELASELAALSKKRFRPPGSPRTRTYAIPTLQRWFYRYKSGGLAALRPRPRADRGHGRHLPAELRELLLQIRRENPGASAELIVRTLVADGRLGRSAVSPPTVRRLFRAHGLDRKSIGSVNDGNQRLRWQAERPNAIWHGDVCHGQALLLPDGSKAPLRIHALMDDATRYLIALQAFHSEREEDMLALWVRALRQHGVPDTLYLDNGSTYRGDALKLACERLGTTLVHAKPYDPQARGKMERFWRTLRSGCLQFIARQSSLDEVNARLHAFRDRHYHVAPHAGLMGRAPGQVWLSRINELPHDSLDENRLREALTVRERRRVRRDTTISLDGDIWELEAGFLAGGMVTVARCLALPDCPPWVEHEGRRLTLHPVDPVKNARRSRKRREPGTPQAAAVPFAPCAAVEATPRAGALEGAAMSRLPLSREATEMSHTPEAPQISQTSQTSITSPISMTPTPDSEQ